MQLVRCIFQVFRSPEITDCFEKDGIYVEIFTAAAKLIALAHTLCLQVEGVNIVFSTQIWDLGDSGDKQYITPDMHGAILNFSIGYLQVFRRMLFLC